MKFWLQTKAPAGNWSDNLGSEDKAVCISHGRYLKVQEAETVRVVERVDTVVWQPK